MRIQIKTTLITLCLCCSGASAATLSVTPSAISNQYAGIITLAITGLTNGETVVVQKFADANTNGVIDAADWPIQQYRLKDGSASVIGGVTNINVPRDSTSANGAITSPQSLLTAGIAQQFVGKYLYKLSSPAGRFAPITNLFTITNCAFGQSFTGSVRSSGTNVPNAGVLVFTPSSDGQGLGRPVAGTMANNSGSYAIKVPPGSYLLWAFKKGYVADLSASPVLTLSAGATITTNLNLVPGTRTISGRVVDAATNSIGLPGILAAWMSTAGQLAVQFTDTNGNFSASVTPGEWGFGGDDAPFAVLGYLQLEDWPGVDTTTGSVSSVTIAATKGTALFYGSVKDDQNRPLPGLSLYGNNNGDGLFNSSATTDQNGDYVMALNAEVWAVEVDNNYSGYGNYIFSPTRSADVTFTNGQAVQQNFTAILATNVITGYLRDATTTNGIADVGVPAWATINGTSVMQYARTGPDGSYSMNVANGSWSVSVNCHCGYSDCLGTSYQCPDSQIVIISNNNAVVNFVAQPCGPLQVTTPSLPDGTANSFYSFQLQASGCNEPFTWSLSPGSGPLPSGINLNGDNLGGTPSTAGTYNFSVRVTDNNLNTADKALSIIINPGLQVTTTTLPNGTSGVFYSKQLQATGGQLPYNWYLPGGSTGLPGMNLSTSGVLSGTPGASGVFSFQVGVYVETPYQEANQWLSLTINPAASPLQVTTVSLPNGTLNTFYNQPVNASGGQQPYSWSLAPGSAPLPPGLNLSSVAGGGTISGTPTNSGTFFFYVRVTDALSVTADGLLSIYIPTPPLQITTLSLPNAQQGAPYTNQLQASGGQMPYSWSLAPGSLALPPNLNLATGGVISGMAATNGTYFFIVRITDGSFAFTNRSLSLTINPKPTLTALNRTGNQFQLRLNGATGQNYTVEFSTALANPNWFSLLITNPTAASVTIPDPSATNATRFYRALVGP